MRGDSGSAYMQLSDIGGHKSGVSMLNMSGMDDVSLADERSFDFKLTGWSDKIKKTTVGPTHKQIKMEEYYNETPSLAKQKAIL